MEASAISSHDGTSTLCEASIPLRNPGCSTSSPHLDPSRATPESQEHPSLTHPGPCNSSGEDTAAMTAAASALETAAGGSTFSSISGVTPSSSSSVQGQDHDEGAATQAASGTTNPLTVQGMPVTYGDSVPSLSHGASAADAVTAQMQQVSLAGTWMAGGSGPHQAFSQPPAGLGPASQHAPALSCKDPCDCELIAMNCARKVLSLHYHPPHSPPLPFPLRSPHPSIPSVGPSNAPSAHGTHLKPYPYSLPHLKPNNSAIKSPSSSSSSSPLPTALIPPSVSVCITSYPAMLPPVSHHIAWIAFKVP